MRVSFVIYRPNLSGGARVTAKHAQMLKAAGHEVFVTGLGKSKPDLLSRIRGLRHGKLLKETVPDPQHFISAGVDVNMIDYEDSIEAHHLPDADIVIATFWRTAEWVAKLPSENGKKVYFIQSHEIFPYFPEERVRATYRMPMHQIAISEWVSRTMEQEYGNPKPDVVPNSADFDTFSAPEREKNKKPRVGILYAPSSVKGFDVARDAIEIVRRTIPELNVVSFGSTEPTDDLPLPESCEFHFRPPQSKIRDIYASCDAWIVGSRVEGFHLPPIEAMACRTPVISTRVGGPEDIIQDGVNGFLVEVEDVDSLAAKTIELLHASDEKWRAMSEAAFRTAHSYTWQDAGDRFEKALLRAMKS